MSMLKKIRPILAGLGLAIVTAICLLTIMEVETTTKAQIESQEQQKLQHLIAQLLPSQVLNNNTILECYLISDKKIGHNMPLFVAKQQNEIVGYILSYQTSRGYSNPLIFIAGFNPDLSINQVDIRLSRETPGIGDKINKNKSNFLDSFAGKNLNNTNWDVKKFGGEFDYFTGATVTSRAAVLATKDALSVMQNINLNELKKCKVK